MKITELLELFLNEYALSGIIEGTENEKNEDGSDDKDHISRVHLMTVHSSKGLEFPIVFAAGLEDGIFPFKYCASMGEERRLCFVDIFYFYFSILMTILFLFLLEKAIILTFFYISPSHFFLSAS